MLFGGYKFLYEIQSVPGECPKGCKPCRELPEATETDKGPDPYRCPFGHASIQRQLKGTRDPRPYQWSFSPNSIQNIQIYNIYMYNICIYTPLYNICIKDIFFSLKPVLGHICYLPLELERRFHIIPYSNYGFSIFPNFEGPTLKSGFLMLFGGY